MMADCLFQADVQGGMHSWHNFCLNHSKLSTREGCDE